MRTILLAAVMLLTAVEAPHGASAAPDASPPEARTVVARGIRSLDQAIRTARTSAAPSRYAPDADPVTAVVLDATPHTREHAMRIAAAVQLLAREIQGEWRLAKLGARFVPAQPDGDTLLAQVRGLLAVDSEVANTTAALRRSVRSLDVRGGCVVYLADWRFEDDHDLEALLRDLRHRQLTFGVVGSEAAFEHGWNDGVLDLRDRMRGGFKLGAPEKEDRYGERIGRDPFTAGDANAPWHGGDSAFPLLPYRFSEALWITEFAPSALRFGRADPRGAEGRGDLEDLMERMGRKRKTFESAGGRKTPLPSAFGPYGLMRAAAMTGGRYVLWSWNPSRRASLTYDHARCNQFGPDLRDRKTIRKDAARRPLARALFSTWGAIARKGTALAMHTPPIDKGARAQPIDLLEETATSLPTVWMNRSMHRDFLRKATRWRDAARKGAGTLDRALSKTREPLDPVDRRLAADAALLRHILLVLDFELSEALAAAGTVPDDAWDNDAAAHPGIRPVRWIEPGDDPDQIRTTGVPLFADGHGARVEAARAEQLRRYRSTPFGVQVAANAVDTWQLTTMRKLQATGKPRVPGRTPSESETTPPAPTPRRPGGGSSGGGPSTGGG